MLQIGRTSQSGAGHAPDFTDPLGLLVHCHAKIEAHLSALERAAQLLRTDDEADFASAMQAIVAARSHFAGPGVKHTADEEESLFPRLRRFASDADGGLMAAMQELEAQHRKVESVHAWFDSLVDAGGPNPLPGSLDVGELELTIAELVGLYGPHIRMENEIVFPEAARILPPEEILALGSEMRARRGLSTAAVVKPSGG